MKQHYDAITDWTHAYDNRGAVPDFEEYFYDWGRDAASFRAAHPPREISYGAGARERLDLFMPDDAPRGLNVFIHGGWWMFFDKSYFSHFAAGALQRGWAVAIPSYTLCPDIRISGIADQMARAVTLASDEVPEGPLTLSGHSAGGHLATFLGIEDGLLPESVGQRLARIVTISGVHDLRALLDVERNASLRVDMTEALKISPALHLPRRNLDMVSWVGGDETPEFRRQSALLAGVWGGYVGTQLHEAQGKHHFDVIDPLTAPDSELTHAVTMAVNGNGNGHG